MSRDAARADAFLALWNDIDPSRREDYERWHTLEHVPERVWAPGFLSGTRYVATRPGQPRYFTRYDLNDLSALETAAYQDLVDHPTPWSASMRPALSQFLRKPCRQVALAGASRASALLVLRAVLIDGSDGAMTQSAHRLLAEGARHNVTSVTVGRVESAGPQAMQNVDEAPAGHEWIFLVEATAVERLDGIEALARSLIQAATHQDLDNGKSAPWFAASHYRYASSVTHHDVAGPSRPAPRTDLFTVERP